MKNANTLARRNFIKNTYLGMMFISLHPEACFSTSSASSSSSKTTESSVNLIENIKLLTMSPLEEMRQFYHTKIGFPILNQTEKDITFIAGKSTLTFVKIAEQATAPWYHFAFNIPENKILKARVWQRQRSELLETPKRLQASNYPSDVRHFRNWNAHSVFFFDPAGNLVEYIARHGLNNGQKGDFSVRDILNISEIGFIVDDQEKMAKAIHQQFGLEAYPKGTDFWWSMGSEHGLLLCLRKRLWAQDMSYSKQFDIFKTEATIRGHQNLEATYGDFPYKIQMKQQS